MEKKEVSRMKDRGWLFTVCFAMVLASALWVTGSILSGCGKQIGAGVGGANFFPHNDGYVWNYLLTSSSTTDSTSPRLRFDGNSTLFGSIPVQHFKSGTVITSTGQVTNETTSYVRVTDAGVYTYGFRDIRTDSPTMEASTFLVFPFDIGTKWRPSATSDTVEVVARENVTVPAGTFDCYKLIQNASSYTAESWIGSGAGVVKSRQSITSGSAKTVTDVVLQNKNF